MALWKKGGAGGGFELMVVHRSDADACVGWIMQLFNKVGRAVVFGAR
jgi:hypothetical protein